MNAPRIRRLGLAAVLAGLVLGAPGDALRAADHGDAPGVRLDGRKDINDLYAFQSPATPSNVVFILTVSPLAGALSPVDFATRTRYEFLVDTDGDAIEDGGFRFTFGKPGEGGVQAVKMKSFGFGKIAAKGATAVDVAIPGGGQFRADRFDDPFFFDFVGFRAGLQFSPSTSVDFFRGFNTLAIVLEVPRALFGVDPIGVWAVTKAPRQVDRSGRPAINTVLIPAALKDAFNRGVPSNDRTAFGDAARTTLMALGNDAPTSAALADFLLPDILTIDTSDAGGFPNGRRLADDVIDIELALVSNGAVTTDEVPANDRPFLGAFPYLAPPH
jgi:hypothetical protein